MVKPEDPLSKTKNKHKYKIKYQNEYVFKARKEIITNFNLNKVEK